MKIADKQKEYELGLKIKEIIESPVFKSTFVTPKQLLLEMFVTGEDPYDLIGNRYLVRGYGFVKDFVYENLR